MSKKNYRQSYDSKQHLQDDSFENFGYDVKNIRRQTKKKVTKFKQAPDYYEDSC